MTIYVSMRLIYVWIVGLYVGRLVKGSSVVLNSVQRTGFIMIFTAEYGPPLLRYFLVLGEILDHGIELKSSDCIFYDPAASWNCIDDAFPCYDEYVV